MRCHPLLTLLALAMFAPTLRAEDMPQVEFVRALRTKYGPRLADEYLDRLRPSPQFQGDPRLSLESARTRVERGLAESNVDTRLRLFQQAQAEVDAFLKKNPAPELAAEARLIGVQLTNSRGKALLAQALRQPTPETQQTEAMKARQILLDAERQMQAALTQLEA